MLPVKLSYHIPGSSFDEDASSSPSYYGDMSSLTTIESDLITHNVHTKTLQSFSVVSSRTTIVVYGSIWLLKSLFFLFSFFLSLIINGLPRVSGTVTPKHRLPA